MFFFEKIIEVFIYMKVHTSEMSKSVSVYIRIHHITTTQIDLVSFLLLLFFKNRRDCLDNNGRNPGEADHSSEGHIKA